VFSREAHRGPPRGPLQRGPSLLDGLATVSSGFNGCERGLGGRFEPVEPLDPGGEEEEKCEKIYPVPHCFAFLYRIPHSLPKSL